MNETQLHRSVSAYFFAMAVTLILCAFAAGILYIDMSANDTIMSAGGLLYPIMQKLLMLAERMA